MHAHKVSSTRPMSLSRDRDVYLPASATGAPLHAIHLHAADDDETRQSATFLVEKMYRSRGYKTQHNDDSHQGAATSQAGHHSLTLLVHDTLRHPVGTITYTGDGPQGLLADQLYPEVLDTLRQQGERLAEITRLAIDSRGDSLPILAALISQVYLHGLLMGHTVGLIEVNPRHVRFYETVVGLKRAGPLRQCPRVDAPAVLMSMHRRDVEEQVHLWGGHKAAPTQAIDSISTLKSNFYRYFHSPAEQDALLVQLAAQSTTASH